MKLRKKHPLWKTKAFATASMRAFYLDPGDARG
jgi:hypothetical protein